jgi:hypothetical protein
MDSERMGTDVNNGDHKKSPQQQSEAFLFLKLQLQEAEKALSEFESRLILDNDLEEQARSIENQKAILENQLKILAELNGEEGDLNLEQALKERIKAAEIRISAIVVEQQPARERLDEYWLAKAQYDICSSLLSYWWNWLANGELKFL